jgi:beta-aspartyl-dipeptidase (metallo-type)
MWSVITGGDLYAPEHVGVTDVLIVNGKIAHIGTEATAALSTLKAEFERIDAAGCKVIPGIVDPHEHLIGGSGETGFQSQTPEIFASELAVAGITTVVGCLGVDTDTRNMPALLAKAKGLREEGISAFLYSGGYRVPPATLTGSLRTDMLYVQEVIGAGEVAISDRRSDQPDSAVLARLVKDAYVGGLLTGKAGVTHFHVGDEVSGLEPLKALLNNFEIAPESIYPTHVERTRTLMAEAMELTRRGVTIDIDTVEEDLAGWVKLYRDGGCDPGRLTVSSDAAISSPSTLFAEVRSCILDSNIPIDYVLPLVTRNPARILKLTGKGGLYAGYDADAVVLSSGMEVRAVVARGKTLVRDGKPVLTEQWRKRSNRRIVLEHYAERNPDTDRRP